MTDEYGTHSYIYDHLYRLTQATHPQPANPLENFDYDQVGNRYPNSNVYSAANQLLEDDTYIYSYDKNGNTISKTNKTTNVYTKYYWNAENQMTRLEKYTSTPDPLPYSTAGYTYDGLGRRVAKNVDNTVTKYLYDMEDILLELDATDNITARYTHGPGIDEPISLDKDAQSYYYIADGLGSIVKLVDTTGNVVNNYIYDSFGNIMEKTEGVANPYTYTAREYDTESGLYYYRFRYYDARVGRFLSEDPIGFWGGINFYAYLNNNPINSNDPYGLSPAIWIRKLINFISKQFVKKKGPMTPNDIAIETLDKEIERIKRESGPNDPRIKELERAKEEIKKNGLPPITESIRETIKIIRQRNQQQENNPPKPGFDTARNTTWENSNIISVLQSGKKLACY
jgi:RHS repeat-associated protein